MITLKISCNISTMNIRIDSIKLSLLICKKINKTSFIHVRMWGIYLFLCLNNLI